MPTLLRTLLLDLLLDFLVTLLVPLLYLVYTRYALYPLRSFLIANMRRALRAC